MNNYIKQNWNEYDESKTYEENKKNYAIIAPEYLNHMEEGIHVANDKTDPITNVTVGSVQSNEQPTASLTNGTLHLQIPKGEKGDQGEPGRDGVDGADGKNGSKGDPGQDGLTPTIGDDNHWHIGDTDTGIKAIIDPLEYTSEESGLEDTPVGHVIAHFGTTAPKHYLICDGSIYNINDYPKLAEHFRNDFGKINQFGGDGTTTFAVPDLRGEFLRGVGQSSRDTGSGAEKAGTHQNPSKMQSIYVWDTNGNPQLHAGCTDDVNDTLTQDNEDLDKKYVESPGKNLVCNFATKTVTTSKTTRISLRPTNTSVLYCIKCEPTYYVKLNPEEIYSLEEREIGRWVNGEVLYQRTFIFDDIPSVTQYDQIYTTMFLKTFDELGLTGDLRIIKSLCAHYVNGHGVNNWIPIPIHDTITITSIFDLVRKAFIVYFKCASTVSNPQIDKIIATFQYTKN